MDNSIIIVVPINAKPECRNVVLSRLVELTTETRKEDGNVFYKLHEKVDDPAAFVIYECWRDQEALDFHMDQKYLKNFLGDSSAWLREPIKGTICREIQI